MKKPHRLTPLLIALVLLLSGCRMRIIDGMIADQVMELEQTEPAETPDPTPTPVPEPTPTPKPDAPKTPNPDERQADPDSNIHTITPDQSGDIDKTKEKLSVTLDPNGGTCGKTAVEVQRGGVYGRLPDAQRSGCTFTGWYFTRNGGTRVTENTIVTLAEPHTLYAHW